MIDAKQYIKNKERLKKAEASLDEGDKWNNPKYSHWKEEFSRILEENLEFESVHKIDTDWTEQEKKVDEKAVK